MVSVVVLTYNPDIEKLKKTLVSILLQKDVDFEIIVADDGSKTECFGEIRNLFLEYKFDNYSFVENKVNQGTIKNYLSGLEVAKGDYIYGISSGDFLYDELTLKTFLEVATQKNIDILFGDAIPYIKDGEEISIDFNQLTPMNPTTFDNEKDFKKVKREFTFRERITGPCYFRKKEIALHYFNEILRYDLKYVEDNTSALLALMDDIRIIHYGRPICWYEKGNGITTDRKDIVQIEFEKIYNKLNQEKKSPIIDCACIRMNVENKFKVKLVCMLKHPIIYFKHVLYMLECKKNFYYGKYDTQQLKTQLSEFLL